MSRPFLRTSKWYATIEWNWGRVNGWREHAPVHALKRVLIGRIFIWRVDHSKLLKVTCVGTVQATKTIRLDATASATGHHHVVRLACVTIENTWLKSQVIVIRLIVKRLVLTFEKNTSLDTIWTKKIEKKETYIHSSYHAGPRLYIWRKYQLMRRTHWPLPCVAIHLWRDDLNLNSQTCDHLDW